MRRHLSLVGLAAAGIGLCVGAWMVHDGTQTTAPPRPAAADALRPPAVSPVAPTARPVVAVLPPSPPTRIRIPEIKVNAPFTDLSLDSSYHLQVPPLDEPNLAGWYRDGASPGSTGNAIVLGHVDNRRGPAVFYALGALHKGDTIHIDRKDHRTAVFTIYAIQVYDKDAFPSQTVYGATARPELRVITCGGGFNKTAAHYLGNVVVFAHLTAIASDGH
jgi:hypothetical protein